VQGVVGRGLGATAAVLAAARGLPARRLVLQAPVTDLAATLRARMEAAGFAPEHAAPVLRRLERHIGVGLETLDWQRALRGLEQPVLFLPDPMTPANIARAVRFLQQGKRRAIPAAPAVPFRTAI
jgi:hypothetical protein